MDGLLLRMLLAADSCCRIGRLLTLLVTPAVEVAVLLFSVSFGGFGEGGLSLLSCSWFACRGGEGLISISACVAAGVLGVSSAPCFVGAGATFLGPWVVFGLLLVEGPKAGVHLGGLGIVIDEFHRGSKGLEVLFATGARLGLESFAADSAGLCVLLLSLGGGEGVSAGERFRLWGASACVGGSFGSRSVVSDSSKSDSLSESVDAASAGEGWLCLESVSAWLCRELVRSWRRFTFGL